MTRFFQLWSSFAHPALAQLDSPIFVNPFSFHDWNLDAKFDSFLSLPSTNSLKALLVLFSQILMIFSFNTAMKNDTGEDGLGKPVAGFSN